MREIEEAPVGDDVAAKGDDEDLSPERMNVGSYGLEPVDETILARQSLAPRGLRARAGRIAAGAVLVVFGNRALPYLAAPQRGSLVMRTRVYVNLFLEESLTRAS